VTGFAAHFSRLGRMVSRTVTGEEDVMEIGLIAIGAGLAVGLSAIATAYAQGRIGAAGAGALAERPELFGSVLVLLALPETMVILGFAVSAMIILLLGG
jgi:V/A-type H+/Na+-transporting ATPase subunit K